jgi:hypothetical protein
LKGFSVRFSNYFLKSGGTILQLSRECYCCSASASRIFYSLGRSALGLVFSHSLTLSLSHSFTHSLSLTLSHSLSLPPSLTLSLSLFYSIFVFLTTVKERYSGRLIYHEYSCFLLRSKGARRNRSVFAKLFSLIKRG